MLRLPRNAVTSGNAPGTSAPKSPPNAYNVMRAAHPEWPFERIVNEVAKQTWERGGPACRGLAGRDLIRFGRRDGLNLLAELLANAYAVVGPSQPHEVHVATANLCHAN